MRSRVSRFWPFKKPTCFLGAESILKNMPTRKTTKIITETLNTSNQQDRDAGTILDENNIL